MKNTKKTIVVKLGTNVLTSGSKRLDRVIMLERIRECAMLYSEGHNIIIVTSAAVAAGREYLDYPELPKTAASKQLLAAVGQSRLIQYWEQLFSIYHIKTGQLLLTRSELENRERFSNTKEVLKALLDNRIVPVINENDALATKDVKVGDNDNLSALISVLAGADKLVLLTDQPGLFTADPTIHPEAELISEINEINSDILSLAGDSISGLGTGGMATKLQAATIATRSGIEVVIAAGNRPNAIIDICNDCSVGTKFYPIKTPLEPHKHWLFGAPTAGKLFLNEGATRALISLESSLLPTGIDEVVGNFSRGQVVVLCNHLQRTIARAVTHYSSDELRHIKDCRSQEMLSMLGYEDGSVVIHREDMILM